MEYKFSFSDFVYQVYDIVLEEYYDYEQYNFWPEDIDVYVDDVDDAVKHFELEDTLPVRNKVEDALTNVKRETYIRTFIDDYSEAVIDELIDDIHKSLHFMEDMLIVDMEEVGVVQDFEPMKIDIKPEEDLITIECDRDLMEALMLVCINGYGMFVFDSLEQFRNSYEGYSAQKIADGHLYAFSYFPSIYGVHAFKPNIEYIERYKMLGDPDDYTMEDVRDGLLEFSII